MDVGMVATILIGLVILWVAWKILKGIVRIALVLLVIVVLGYILLNGLPGA